MIYGGLYALLPTIFAVRLIPDLFFGLEGTMYNSFLNRNYIKLYNRIWSSLLPPVTPPITYTGPWHLNHIQNYNCSPKTVTLVL